MICLPPAYHPPAWGLPPGSLWSRMSEPPEAPCPAPQRIKGLGVELPKLCRQNKETGVTGNKGGDEIGQEGEQREPQAEGTRAPGSRVDARHLCPDSVLSVKDTPLFPTEAAHRLAPLGKGNLGATDLASTCCRYDRWPHPLPGAPTTFPAPSLSPHPRSLSSMLGPIPLRHTQAA